MTESSLQILIEFFVTSSHRYFVFYKLHRFFVWISGHRNAHTKKYQMKWCLSWFNFLSMSAWTSLFLSFSLSLLLLCQSGQWSRNLSLRWVTWMCQERFDGSIYATDNGWLKKRSSNFLILLPPLHSHFTSGFRFFQLLSKCFVKGNTSPFLLSLPFSLSLCLWRFALLVLPFQRCLKIVRKHLTCSLIRLKTFQ